MSRFAAAAALLLAVPALSQGDEAPGLTVEMLESMPQLPGGIGPLPKPAWPADNPSSPEKIELGRRLYFDTRLSGDGKLSCASCHHPDKGYGDGKPRAVGFDGKELGRHSPTVLNTAYNTAQFWDGRAATLEEQAKGPIMATGEMNAGSEEAMIKRLLAVKEYAQPFQKIFGQKPNLDNVAKAIAAFERTVVSGDSPFDRWAKGQRSALNAAQKRGLVVFVGKGNCTACHNGPNFTDNKYHNLGLAQAGPLKEDEGRFAVSKDPKDKGAFKTPGLRNIADNAPYMHAGTEATLESVVEVYDRGGGPGAGKSELIFPLELSAREKQDLVEFLKALSGPLPKIVDPHRS